MDVVAAAYNAYLRTIHSPARVCDPYDRVMANYTPLSDYGCIAIQENLLTPLIVNTSCAESALMLAMSKVWFDKHGAKEDKKRPQLDVLETRAPRGLTIAQMIRRLQRLSIKDFPIYTYDVRTDEFLHEHGVPRDDNYAIVFVPADPSHNLNVAHWTFATVIHKESPEIQPEQEPAVIYTTMPVDRCSQNVYWRARVTPENKDAFSKMKEAKLACDCDWRVCCNHEEGFTNDVLQRALARNPHQGRMHRSGPTGSGLAIVALATQRLLSVSRPIRCCLAEEQVVQGTWRAQIIRGVTSTPYEVRLGANGRVTVVTPQGRVCEQMKLHHCEGLHVKGVYQKIKKYFHSDKMADIAHFRELDVPPYRLQLIQYSDYEQCILSGLYEKTAALAVSKISPLFGITGIRQYVAHVRSAECRMDWAADQDLSIQLPRRSELLARLSVRGELTRDNVMDTVRRIAAEERWNIDLSRREFRDWLERTVSETGMATMIPAPRGTDCWNCLQRSKTYRHLCKKCKKYQSEQPLEPVCAMDAMVTFVGMRPIWSKLFTPPVVELKADVDIYDKSRNRYLVKAGQGMTTEALYSYFRRFYGERSVRGRLAGPMFLGFEPTCFPRGEGVAALAFVIRLGAKRAHQAQAWFYDLAFTFVRPWLTTIDPESWDYFITHFSGAKRIKMLEAHQEDNEGWAPNPKLVEENSLLVELIQLTMTVFPKAEKSNNMELAKDGHLTLKETEKPRCICSPNPLFLSRMGRYTHAQTKWLAATFTWKDHLFYAGCAQPEDLNCWLNRTLSEIADPWTLVDDISAMDANHSKESFTFHDRVRAIQFPNIPTWIEAGFQGEARLKVRVGRFILSVSFVNASGVSDTSYKNSMICLIVRLIAVAHGFRDIREFSPEELHKYLHRVMVQIYLSASGDDGLTRLPDRVDGISIHDFSLSRYKQAWSWSGFDIKVQLVPPNRWRMATYLAMRPVWAGTRYEWAPEPARRLKNMFWQFDNGLHPTAWARGVARQVQGTARAVPILSDVCDWFLDVTSGPEAQVDVINPYSAFAGMKSSAVYNNRAENEFLMDYRLTREDLEIFRRTLRSTRNHLINLDTHAIRRVFEEES